MKKRTLALLLALMLIIGATVGGTIAWLTSKTEAVVNTFTVGDINITLQEHPLKEDGSGELDKDKTPVYKVSYDYVPGDTLNKDPYVTVKKDSEPCYVFVKVEAKNNFVTADTDDKYGAVAKILDFKIDSTWTAVPDHEGYYSKTIETKVTEDTDLNILLNEKVTVSDAVTKEMVGVINANKPELIFTAAAIQKDNITDVETAWQKLFGTNS